MKKEYIEKVNNCSLGFWINLDASGFDTDNDDLSADEFDHVDYYIKDGKLQSWCYDEIMDLADLDDQYWEEEMNPDEDDIEDGRVPKTWFDCFITELMNYIIQNGLNGSDEFWNLIDDNRILIVILKTEDTEDIIEEIDEWNISENVD